MNKVIEQEFHLYMFVHFTQKSLIFGVVKNDKIIYVQMIFH